MKSPFSILRGLAAFSIAQFAVVSGPVHAGTIYNYTGTETTGTLAPGTYYIVAHGAQGGGSQYGSGGLGAEIGGQFTLTSSTTLTILVGQEGQYGTGIHGASGGGGGGGTFVLTGSTPLIVAGGGGGNNGYSSGGGSGLTTTTGGGDSGGTDGAGGSAGITSGGGGGLTGNGGGGNGGQSFDAGGAGGAGTGDGLGGSSGSGGFGGGGAGGATDDNGGGAGGYSGGSGGGLNEAGGGGGSFLSALAVNADEISGVQSGNGYVEITPVGGVIGGVVLGNVIIAKGDPVPGVSSAKFLLADTPAVDSAGDFAIKAFVSGTSKPSSIAAANDAGIWLYTGSAGTLIARTGTTGVSVTGTFSSLSDPVIHPSGSIAYTGALKGGDVTKTKSNATGVWLVKGGTTSLLARAGGTNAELAGAAYGQFVQTVIEEPSGVAFLAKLSGTGVKPASNMALCAQDSSGAFHTIVRTGQSVTTGTSQRTIKSINVFGLSADEKGQSRSLDPLSGFFAFGLGFTDKSTAIALATRGSSGFTLDSIAEISGTSVPGVASATWSTFGNPAVNSSGDVAFHGTLKSTSAAVKITTANNAGIWLDTNAGTTLVARTSGTAPGTGGALFASLQDPVLNNNGEIAFIGSLKTEKNLVAAATSSGIWVTTSGTLGIVARAGDSVPVFSGTVNTMATFAKFQQVVLPDIGGPIFIASLKGTKPASNTGLWAADSSGQIQLVAQTGNSVEVNGALKTIKSFSIFTVAPLVSGQSRSFDAQSRNIALMAEFTDRTWAIIQTLAP